MVLVHDDEDLEACVVMHLDTEGVQEAACLDIAVVVLLHMEVAAVVVVDDDDDDARGEEEEEAVPSCPQQDTPVAAVVDIVAGDAQAEAAEVVVAPLLLQDTPVSGAVVAEALLQVEVAWRDDCLAASCRVVVVDDDDSWEADLQIHAAAVSQRMAPAVATEKKEVRRRAAAEIDWMAAWHVPGEVVVVVPQRIVPEHCRARRVRPDDWRAVAK